MRTLKLSLLVLVLSYCSILPSQADITVVGELNMMGIGGDSTFKGQQAYGGGFLFEIRSGKSMGYEFGAIYSQRAVDAGGTDRNFTFLEVPFLFKYHFAKIPHGGIGAYYAQGLSGDFSAANLKKADYGVEASLGFAFPRRSKFKFFAEVRGLVSMVSASSAADLKWGGAQVHAGFTLSGRKSR